MAAFSERFARFVKATPDATPAVQPGAERIIEERIHEQDAAFIHSVQKKYAEYQSPLSAETARDEALLLSAYTLFCAIKEAEAVCEDDGTHLVSQGILSPLCKNERYTSGGDFVYLQCWLLLEQKKTDYVPQFAKDAAGRTTLRFVPAKHAHHTLSEQETLGTIQRLFYS